MLQQSLSSLAFLILHIDKNNNNNNLLHMKTFCKLQIRAAMYKRYTNSIIIIKVLQ